LNKLAISTVLRASALQRAAEMAKRHAKVLRSLLDTTTDPIVLKAQGIESVRRLEHALRQSRIFSRDMKINELHATGFRMISRPDKYHGLLKEFQKRITEN
jgi:hypothetical protein